MSSVSKALKEWQEKVAAAIQFCADHDIVPDDLADLVREDKEEEARDINDAGVKDQIEYLVDGEGGVDGLAKWLQEKVTSRDKRKSAKEG